MRLDAKAFRRQNLVERLWQLHLSLWLDFRVECLDSRFAAVCKQFYIRDFLSGGKRGYKSNLFSAAANFDESNGVSTRF